MLLAAVASGVIVHFFWAQFHKAEMDAKDVLLDQLRQAKAWADNQLSEFKAKIK